MKTRDLENLEKNIEKVHRKTFYNFIIGFDLLFLFSVLWMILPELIYKKIFHIYLFDGLYFSSCISHKNIFFLITLLFIRIHYSSNYPSIFFKIFDRYSESFKAFLLGVFVFLLFINVNSQRTWVSGDTIPAKLLAITILEEKNLDFNEFISAIEPSRMYCLHLRNQKWISSYPLGTGLTVLPIYAIFAFTYPEIFSSWKPIYKLYGGDDLYNIANVLELYSASLLTALSVVIVYLISAHITRQQPISLWIALGYALGTSALSTASGALWQHTSSLLFISLCILLILKHEKKPKLFFSLSGLSAAWALGSRSTNIFIIFFLILWIFKKYRTYFWQFIISFVILTTLNLFLNYYYYGELLGSYAGQLTGFILFRFEAFLGLFLSPSRGLFVFSPFLLIVLIVAILKAKEESSGFLFYALCSAFFTSLLLSFWGHWTGGVCYGPRLMTEVMLMIILTMPYTIKYIREKKWLWELFLITLLISWPIHIIGAHEGDNRWSERCYSDKGSANFWKIKDSQVIWTLKLK